MSRTFWISVSLATALLAPTRAWEASVAQNLTVTIVKETISVNPTSLTFSPQTTGAQSPAQIVTVSNTGGMAFPLSSIGLAGGNAGNFAETNNCPASLAISANCQVSVTFAPTAVGAKTASVVVSATGGGTYTAALSGTAVSLSGATIPSATGLGDASGNVWTVSGGQVYRNGFVDPITGGVALVLYYHGTVYQQTSSGAWYQLNTTSWPAGSNGWTWLAGGDPRTASASGATVPSATDVTDASHNVYAVAGGQIYRNGVLDPITGNVSLLLYSNGTIYQQTSSGAWYQLTSTSWPAGSNGWTYLASGDPRTGTGASCKGVAVTPASSLQAVIDAAPANSTFCLAAGTYTQSTTCNSNPNGDSRCTIRPHSGDTYIGAGIGQTILDGQNSVGAGIGQYAEDSSNVVVKNMTVMRYTYANIWYGCGASNWTVQNSEISYGGSIGLLMCVATTLVQNNLIHHNSINGIDCLNSTNATIDNNDLYANDFSQTTSNGPTGQAGNWKCNGGDYVITNNRIHDGWGDGIWLDSLTTSATISGNEIFNMAQACLNGSGCGGSSAIAFEITYPYSDVGTTPHFSVHDNYIHDIAAGGVTSANSGNIEIYNNALASAGTAGSTNSAFSEYDEGYRNEQGVCVSIGCREINISNHNNFIAVPSGQTAFYGSDDGTPGSNWAGSNNTFANNTYYFVSPSTGLFYANGTLQTFPQWQAAGRDTNSTVNYNGGTLPNGVGPRGGFVCPIGMTCP